MARAYPGLDFACSWEVKIMLGKIDIKKILTGAGIAMAGALLTYLTQIITNINLGEWTPIIVAIWSIIVNTLRKILDGVTK